MIESSAIRLLDRSSVAEARRVCVRHASSAGFDESDRSNAAIVATELATNLLRHARDGVLAVMSRSGPPEAEVLLIAVDQGPGIDDVTRSFADGYSSAGSAGTGLGAVARLSAVVDTHSTPDGTVLAATLRRPFDTAASPSVAGFALAKAGQDTNGDAWDCRVVDHGLAVLVCDGLGHGTYANEASAEAVAVFRSSDWRGPREMVATLHVALRPTRGTAAAVALIEQSSGRLRYCGVGNISGCIVTDERSRHLVSQNGILGHAANRITEFDYEWTDASVLVMHSDGISAKWQPADLGPLWERHPGLLAGMLYRDFARGNDDVVAMVLKP